MSTSKRRRPYENSLSDERRLERIAALEARQKREEEEEARRKAEEEAKKRTVVVDLDLFGYICKTGFIKNTLQEGVVEIFFNSADILSICRGNLVEKNHYGQVYRFVPQAIDRIKKIVILRNSPLFWQLAESI